MNPTDTLRPARVTIDDEVAFDAMVPNDNWNGFVCPAFTKEEGLKVAEAFKGYYDEKKDAFVFPHPDYPEDLGEADIFKVAENEMYFIGAWSWCWDFSEGQENPWEGEPPISY